MEKDNTIDRIKQTAQQVLTMGSTGCLYGSRARGDYHEDSDWDLLVSPDKKERGRDDWDKYAWPFTELGWKRNSMRTSVPAHSLNS